MKITPSAAAVLAIAAGCGHAPNAGQAAVTPHLELVVEIDVARELVQADAVLTAPRSAWAEGWVINAALAVTQAQDGLAPVPGPQGGLQLLRRDSDGDPDEMLTARFSYQGVLSRDVMAFPLDRISQDAVELSANSMWLPVHASFSEGYSVAAEITGLPADWTLIAPGDVVQVDEGTWRIHRRTPDLDLALFAAPDYACREAGALTFCAHDLDVPQLAILSRHGSASLALFEGLFGPPEIAETRIALVDRDLSGGYARIGYMVMDLETSDTERHLAGYVSHEFAHSWFSAPIGSPDDHWLIESPAEYAAWRYMETAFGPDVRAEMEALARARMAGSGPLSGAGRASHAALYNKGPIFLADLEARVGRDALDAVLRATLSGQVMSTERFLTAVSDIASPDEAEWARSRIFEE
ncbi:MAG: hypothetical protein ABL308_02740 [Oceanicaulis sp.]